MTGEVYDILSALVRRRIAASGCDRQHATRNPTIRTSRCGSSTTRQPAAPTTPPRASSPTSSSQIWNQQVLTLNQPGAGGGISAKAASQSPNDGYTLYMPATSPFLALPGASGVVAEPAARTAARLRRDRLRAAAAAVHRRLAQVRHHQLPQLIELAKAEAGRDLLRGDGARAAHASDDGAVAGAHRHQAATRALRRRTGAGDERRAGRPRAARARRLRRARRRAEGRSDQGTGGRPRSSGCRASRTCRPSPRPCQASSSARGPCWWRRSARLMPIVRKVNTDMRTALDDPEVKTQVPGQRRVPALHDAGAGDGIRAGAAEDVAAHPGAGGEGDAEIAAHSVTLSPRGREVILAGACRSTQELVNTSKHAIFPLCLECRRRYKPAPENYPPCTQRRSNSL